MIGVTALARMPVDMFPATNIPVVVVQCAEKQVKTVEDLQAIPLRGDTSTRSSRLDALASVARLVAPTEVDHDQPAAYYLLHRSEDENPGLEVA